MHIMGRHAEVEPRNRPGDRTMTDSMYMPVIEGYSGFPIEAQEHHATPGSVEWLLDAVERPALAEQDSLAQYEYLHTASGDPVIALVMQLILDDEERHHG